MIPSSETTTISPFQSSTATSSQRIVSSRKISQLDVTLITPPLLSAVFLNRDQTHVLLGDFGFARELDDGEDARSIVGVSGFLSSLDSMEQRADHPLISISRSDAKLHVSQALQ
jgi:hypothetical protein